jgi:hypothetical protein
MSTRCAGSGARTFPSLTSAVTVTVCCLGAVFSDHFEDIFSYCYATEGGLTFIVREAFLNVLVLGIRETDRGMKHRVSLWVCDMPPNADALRERGVGESTEAGEKKDAAAQCSTGRTNFRG